MFNNGVCWFMSLISSQDSHNDEEKEDGENCVQYLLAITNEGESDLSWLLAHIMSVIAFSSASLLSYFSTEPSNPHV